MTTYGTIPTAAPGPSNLEFFSRAKERIRSSIGIRRPWKEMIQFDSINLPPSFGESTVRIRTNLAYFQVNYAIVVLLILFLSLLWHPVSLIVFFITMAAWLYLYFLRDEPLVIYGRTIDDRAVLIVLFVITLIFLFLTDATVNIMVGFLIGVFVVLVHSVVRRSDDVFVEDEEGLGSGMLLPGGGVPKVPLKEAASSYYSSS